MNNERSRNGLEDVLSRSMMVASHRGDFAHALLRRDDMNRQMQAAAEMQRLRAEMASESAVRHGFVHRVASALRGLWNQRPTPNPQMNAELLTRRRPLQPMVLD